MPKTKPDDSFEEDWGMPPGSEAGEPGDMPEGSIDPERTNFLKPHHVGSRMEGTLELIGVSGSTEFSDVVLHVDLGKRHFRLGLKAFDPGYIALRKKFGSKREDWRGTIHYRVLPYKGKRDGYVAVRP